MKTRNRILSLGIAAALMGTVLFPTPQAKAGNDRELIVAGAVLGGILGYIVGESDRHCGRVVVHAPPAPVVVHPPVVVYPQAPVIVERPVVIERPVFVYPPRPVIVHRRPPVVVYAPKHGAPAHGWGKGHTKSHRGGRR